MVGEQMKIKNLLKKTQDVRNQKEKASLGDELTQKLLPIDQQIIRNHMKAQFKQWDNEDREAKIKKQAVQDNNEDRSEYRW